MIISVFAFPIETGNGHCSNGRLILGEWVACSVGANFTPHIITVNAGEVFIYLF